MLKLIHTHALRFIAFIVLLFWLAAQIATLATEHSLSINFAHGGCSTGNFGLIDRQGTTCSAVPDVVLGFPLIINSPDNTAIERFFTGLFDASPLIIGSVLLLRQGQVGTRKTHK